MCLCSVFLSFHCSLVLSVFKKVKHQQTKWETSVSKKENPDAVIYVQCVAFCHFKYQTNKNQRISSLAWGGRNVWPRFNYLKQYFIQNYKGSFTVSLEEDSKQPPNYLHKMLWNYFLWSFSLNQKWWTEQRCHHSSPAMSWLSYIMNKTISIFTMSTVHLTTN